MEKEVEPQEDKLKEEEVDGHSKQEEEPQFAFPFHAPQETFSLHQQLPELYFPGAHGVSANFPSGAIISPVPTWIKERHLNIKTESLTDVIDNKHETPSNPHIERAAQIAISPSFTATDTTPQTIRPSSAIVAVSPGKIESTPVIRAALTAQFSDTTSHDNGTVDAVGNSAVDATGASATDDATGASAADTSAASPAGTSAADAASGVESYVTNGSTVTDTSTVNRAITADASAAGASNSGRSEDDASSTVTVSVAENAAAENIATSSSDSGNNAADASSVTHAADVDTAAADAAGVLVPHSVVSQVDSSSVVASVAHEPAHSGVVTSYASAPSVADISPAEMSAMASPSITSVEHVTTIDTAVNAAAEAQDVAGGEAAPLRRVAREEKEDTNKEKGRLEMEAQKFQTNSLQEDFVVVPLKSIHTLPLDLLMKIQSVILHVEDDDVKIFHVAAVSRRPAKESTSLQFVSGEVLLLNNAEKQAVLLSPSDTTTVIMWNLSDNSPDPVGKIVQVSRPDGVNVEGAHLYPALTSLHPTRVVDILRNSRQSPGEEEIPTFSAEGGATGGTGYFPEQSQQIFPLLNEDVAQWMHKVDGGGARRHGEQFSSSLGDPLDSEESMSGVPSHNAGGNFRGYEGIEGESAKPTGTREANSSAHDFWPLTDAEYELLNDTNSKLEGFPMISSYPSALISDSLQDEQEIHGDNQGHTAAVEDPGVMSTVEAQENKDVPVVSENKVTEQNTPGALLENAGDLRDRAAAIEKEQNTIAFPSLNIEQPTFSDITDDSGGHSPSTDDDRGSSKRRETEALKSKRLKDAQNKDENFLAVSVLVSHILWYSMSDSASSVKASDTGLSAAPVSQGPPSLPLSVQAFYTFEDGSAYEGQFGLSGKDLEEKPTYVQHGSGTYVKGNYTYSGEWRDGKMTHGTISFPSGDCYEGHLLDGLFHGWGRYTWYKQGKYYEGMWISGLMEGPGAIGHTCRLPGEKGQHDCTDVNASATPFSSTAPGADGSHYECRGVFGAGEFHKTPASQAALYEEYTKRYRQDWLGAALEMLQQLEAALMQNTGLYAYVGGGQSISQAGPLTATSPGVYTGGGRNKNADTSGAAPVGASKKKPPLAPRNSVPGTTHGKDLLGGVLGGSSFVEEERYSSGSSDYVAERYISPPYPSLNEFHVDGVSRLVAATRGYFEALVFTGTNAHPVEVRIPANEQESSDLTLLESARILDSNSVAGRGSGQIIEIILRASDGTGNIFAGIVLVNCNDQAAAPEAAHFRAVALTLPSPHQLKKLR